MTILSRRDGSPRPSFCDPGRTGATWGKDRKMLGKVGNPEVISGLVVVDTWLRNTDRWWKPASRVNLDNVFFSTESGDAPVALRAMDFSHCIAYGRELTRRVKDINDVRDEDVYGLFTEFRTQLKRESVRYYTSRLSGLSRSDFQAAVDRVPNEWEIDSETRMALIDFLTQRASFVAGNIEDWLFSPEQHEFASLDGGDE